MITLLINIDNLSLDVAINQMSIYNLFEAETDFFWSILVNIAIEIVGSGIKINKSGLTDIIPACKCCLKTTTNPKTDQQD